MSTRTINKRGQKATKRRTMLSCRTSELTEARPEHPSLRRLGLHKSSLAVAWHIPGNVCLSVSACSEGLDFREELQAPGDPAAAARSEAQDDGTK
mmetsp:Transcript_63933/g.154535  ORF Transcript_63933/g.154535 Transcript_63933/m.154535 type:complete len:95 (-) Transcript_63933:1353-1637(-)